MTNPYAKSDAICPVCGVKGFHACPSKAEALKPCPFCGNDAPMFGHVEDKRSPDHGGHFIQCTKIECGASIGLRFAHGDDPRPLLAEQWNRRTGVAPKSDYDVLDCNLDDGC